MFEISSGSEDELCCKLTWKDEVIEILDESSANLSNNAPKRGRARVQRKRNSTVLSPVASPLKGAKKRGRGLGRQSVSVPKPRGRGRGRGGKGVSHSSLDLPIIDSLTPPIRGGRGRKKRGSGVSNSGIDLSFLDLLIPPGGRGRGASNPGLDFPVTDILPPPRGRGRGKRGRGASNSSSNLPVPDILAPPIRGRRGRCRSRGGSSTSRSPRSQTSVVYNVGNCYEYYDASENQPLFDNKKEKKVTNEPATIDLTEPLDLDNEELSVKVYWQFMEVFKFNIRKHQKITQIFDFFVKEKGVSRDRLLFTYNCNKGDRILKPDDTPSSFDYNIAKFIEGGLVNNPITLMNRESPQKKGFIVKFQCQNVKKPFESSVGKDERLNTAMVKFAEHLEVAISDLIFEFDGETISGNNTPKDLEMESGDCIDVKIVKCK